MVAQRVKRDIITPVMVVPKIVKCVKPITGAQVIHLEQTPAILADITNVRMVDCPRVA